MAAAATRAMPVPCPTATNHTLAELSKLGPKEIMCLGVETLASFGTEGLVSLGVPELAERGVEGLLALGVEELRCFVATAGARAEILLNDVIKLMEDAEEETPEVSTGALCEEYQWLLLRRQLLLPRHWLPRPRRSLRRPRSYVGEPWRRAML